MNQQLILNIPADHETQFTHFFWQNNTILRDTLLTSLSFAPQSEQFFYLWGEQGCGKSHVLQASCHYLGQQGFPCAYLPLKQLMSMGSEVLDNLDQLRLIAIDDLTALAGHVEWEEALFHCYNKIVARDNAPRLIMTASQPIAALNIQMPDLRSRLSACIVFHMASLDEPACLEVLQERATNRGLQLPEDVAHFLIRRFPRNPRQLLAIFEQLDQAAWKEQHRLTIPFVKKTLFMT